MFWFQALEIILSTGAADDTGDDVVFDDDDDDYNYNDNNNNNRIQRRNERFVAIFSLRREPCPTRTLKWPRRNRLQITYNTSSAYRLQHVVLRATCYYEGTAQLLSLAEFKSHLFELYLIG